MALIGKKKKRATPEVSTASLPDIIFTLLFFFMVSAKEKEPTLKVEHTMPRALDAKKLTSEDKVSVIHIGKPVPKFEKIYGSQPVIQINNQIISKADLNQLQNWVITEKQAIPAQFRENFLIDIKADGKVPYSYIDDVKTELRKANARNINFNSGSLIYD